MKKELPVVYDIYDYLKENCVGYENRVKGEKLMDVFYINDNKTFRSYIEDIRNSSVLQKIICSEAGKNGGYWIPSNEDEIKATLFDLYKRSMQMLKTYSMIKKKANLDNQYRMKLTKYEKDIYESTMSE